MNGCGMGRLALAVVCGLVGLVVGVVLGLVSG